MSTLESSQSLAEKQPCVVVGVPPLSSYLRLISVASAFCFQAGPSFIVFAHSLDIEQVGLG